MYPCMKLQGIGVRQFDKMMDVFEHKLDSLPEQTLVVLDLTLPEIKAGQKEQERVVTVFKTTG